MTYDQNKLKMFVHKADGFLSKPKSEQIDIFVYFLMTECDMAGVKPVNIKECFDLLNIPAHTNISSYLSKESKKHSSGKKYIRKKDVYVLTKSATDCFNNLLQNHIALPTTDALYPKEIFDNTRQYLVDISEQARSCFDLCLYDACSVMLRKLLEVLIIEAFERHKIDAKIKKTNGDFLFLSDLISALLSEGTWNITRNAKDGFSKIKKLGDLSAHNRRYFSKRSDILNINDSIRVCMQELIVLVDYPTWNTQKP